MSTSDSTSLTRFEKQTNHFLNSHPPTYDVTMRFDDEQERDKYAITTDRGGYVGTIQRVGEKFAFIDARHLRPLGAELIAVYADELQQVMDKIKELEAGIARQ